MLSVREGELRLTVGAAVRDSSSTVIVMCVPSGELPSPVPSLEIDGRVLHPIGGDLSRIGDESFTYAYFPSTVTDELDVVQEGVRLARLRFNGPPADACHLAARGPFDVVTCGALVVVDWRPSLRLDPAQVETIDATVFERGERFRSHGFFLIETRGTEDRPVIRFAFRSTERHDLVVEMKEASVEVDGAIERIRYRPAHRDRLRLISR